MDKEENISLKDLQFSDIYISENIENSRIRGSDVIPDMGVVPHVYLKDIIRLRDVIRAQSRNMPEDATEFSIPFDDVLYRVTVVNDIREKVYALRRGASHTPHFDECRIPPIITDRLLEIRHGLILISGPFSSGKTTVASSYALEFSIRGGLVVTLEDPPELPLSGDHGAGRILQVQIQRDKIEKAIQSTLRMSFDLLFVSEIRTPIMAQELINASINGKLVLSTIHADSLVNALQRITVLADKDGNTKMIRETLSNGLAAVVHMEKDSNNVRQAAEYLLCNQRTKARMLSGELTRIQEDVQQLKARIANGLPID